MSAQINERGEIIGADRQDEHSIISQTEDIIRLRNTRRNTTESPERITQESRKRNRNWIFAICIVLVILVVYNQTHQAPVQQIQQSQTQQAQSQSEEKQIYYVITESGNNLYVRKSPGRINKSANDVIVRIPRGTEVEVLDKHSDSIRLDGFTWWEVRVPTKGINGWAASEYLSSKVSQAQQPQNQQGEKQIYYVITESGNNLYVRKSPGSTNKKSDDIITRIPRGTQVEVVDKHSNSIRLEGFTWWEVRVPTKGINGWVASDYLSTNY